MSCIMFNMLLKWSHLQTAKIWKWRILKHNFAKLSIFTDQALTEHLHLPLFISTKQFVKMYNVHIPSRPITTYKNVQHRIHKRTNASKSQCWVLQSNLWKCAYSWSISSVPSASAARPWLKRHCVIGRPPPQHYSTLLLAAAQAEWMITWCVFV